MPKTESRLDRIEKLLERLAQQELAFREEQTRRWARIEFSLSNAAVRLAILRAPLDDEELTPEAAAALDEALAEFQRGAETLPHEEVLREFGLR
jgi:exonuclease VII small subunit